MSTNHALWSFTIADQGYRIGKEQYGNGLRRNITYEPLTGLLSTLKTTADNGNVFEDVRYTYYPDGNLHQRHNPRRDRLETFTYDPLDRLDTVTTQTPSTGALTTSTYGYDAIGNITSHPRLAPSRTTRLVLTPSRVPAPTATSTTAMATSTAARVPMSRVATSPSNTPPLTCPNVSSPPRRPHEIKYDADQLRVLKTGPQGTTMYAEGLYERHTGSTPGSSVHKYLIHVAGRQVAQIDRTEQGGAITATTQSFLHDDLLGSAHVITDATGAVRHEQQFEPFGKSDSPAFGTTNVSTGFTGHEHDPELGLINMQGRLYDPGIGRFITPDPFVQAPFWSQGLNRYSYVANNPLNLTDPTGFSIFPSPPTTGPVGKQGSGSSGAPVISSQKSNAVVAAHCPTERRATRIVDLTKNGMYAGWRYSSRARWRWASAGGTAGGNRGHRRWRVPWPSWHAWLRVQTTEFVDAGWREFRTTEAGSTTIGCPDSSRRIRARMETP